MGLALHVDSGAWEAWRRIFASLSTFTVIPGAAIAALGILGGVFDLATAATVLMGTLAVAVSTTCVLWSIGMASDLAILLVKLVMVGLAGLGRRALAVRRLARR
jgi:hypothetical protein